MALLCRMAARVRQDDSPAQELKSAVTAGMGRHLARVAAGPVGRFLAVLFLTLLVLAL